MTPLKIHLVYISDPDFFRMEIRTYLEGKKNTYYFVFVLFVLVLSILKSRKKYPTILRKPIDIFMVWFKARQHFQILFLFFDSGQQATAISIFICLEKYGSLLFNYALVARKYHQTHYLHYMWFFPKQYFVTFPEACFASKQAKIVILVIFPGPPMHNWTNGYHIFPNR